MSTHGRPNLSHLRNLADQGIVDNRGNLLVAFMIIVGILLEAFMIIVGILRVIEKSKSEIFQGGSSVVEVKGILRLRLRSRSRKR